MVQLINEKRKKREGEKKEVLMKKTRRLDSEFLFLILNFVYRKPEDLLFLLSCNTRRLQKTNIAALFVSR